jgi:hypothetical protein
VPPRVGWDGIVAQILDSATDAEQVHHAMEVREESGFQSILWYHFSNNSLLCLLLGQDVFGEGTTSQHSGTKVSATKYFRFNPLVGKPESFPIDEIDPDKLQELCDIVDRYMEEDEQKAKLKQLGDIVHPT